MKTTKKAENAVLFFRDPDFPMRFSANSISRVDDPLSAPRALHEALEIKYFYEGTSTLLVGKKTVEVTAGDLVVINPYELHSTIRLGEERGQYHLLMIGLDFFLDGSTGGLDLRAMMIENGLTFRTLIRNDVRIAAIMGRIAAVYAEQGAYWQLSVRGALLELFALLLREYSQESAEEERGEFRTFETVEPALRRIREGYAGHITLDELASLCNVSKCHFCRVFHRVTGKSAMSYLTEYRLRIADLMLSGSGESVGTVAEKCGFGDLTHFCRAYKAQYGASPRQKRKAKQ